MDQEFNWLERLTVKTLQFNLKINTQLGGFVIKEDQIEIIDRKKFHSFSFFIMICVGIALFGTVIALVAPFFA